MMKAEKIWRKIEDAFIQMEAKDIAVEIVTIPKSYLNILEMEPVTLSDGRHIPDRHYYVRRSLNGRQKFISGAKVKIGNFQIQGGDKIINIK